MRGTIRAFLRDRGFGFVKPENGGQDVFIHVTTLKACGIAELNVGDVVWVQSRPPLSAEDSRGCQIRGSQKLKIDRLRSTDQPRTNGDETHRNWLRRSLAHHFGLVDSVAP